MENQPEFQLIKPKEGLYIPLNRVYIYLARLSTAGIRNRGNENAADYILSLQLEWADALHKYETVGVAYKKAYLSVSKESADILAKWLKNKKATDDKNVHALADFHINKLMEETGLTIK